MNTPSVVLLGFSTAGKSHYLSEIEKAYADEFFFLDSDKFVSSPYGGHIFNIFMSHGRDEAIPYIESKEREFIKVISENNSRAQLIAAGPFLVIREGWDKFVEKRNPFIIHFDKSPESVYEGLLQRRNNQKESLDTANPNFGSWDSDVTTELKSGLYEDIPEATAISNIRKHLSRINPIYQRYRHHHIISDELRKNEKRQQELIELIVKRLREGL